MAFHGARGRVTVFGGSPASGSLADTWDYDGTRWMERTPVASPPAVGAATLVEDRSAGRLVLFGGYTPSGGASAETWQWDGATWVRAPAAQSPPPRYNAALAWDADRGRAVLFSGIGGGAAMLLDTWEWDGRTWEQRAPATSPTPRSGASMAYDLARRRTVLFGGLDQVGAPDDTWEWDGVTWTLATPAQSPRARTGAAMAYDEVRQRVVLFGGLGFSTTSAVGLNDTWEWDGAQWLERVAPSPPPRRYASATFDRLRARVVLFGGTEMNGISGLSNHTWEWDGTAWEQHAVAPGPTAREGGRSSIAYDVGRQRVVLFGGTRVNGPALADTWEWDGTRWELRVTAHAPFPRSDAPMAYDHSRHVVVLYGGAEAGSVYHDTWLWDGADWTHVTPPQSPPATHQALSMSEDPTRQRVVLTLSAGGGGGQTWEWDGTTWAHGADHFSGRLAFDATRARTVMVDERRVTSEWDGVTWTQRANASMGTPPAQRGFGLAFDADRSRAVLFGGVGTPSFLDDTWEWDGTRWTLRGVGARPPAQNAVMVFDEARHRMVMYGESGTWFLLPE